MLLTKHKEMSELLDWFERDNDDPNLSGGYVQFWGVDEMLNWVSTDRRIIEHTRLPEFFGFWCDSDLFLYAELVNEFVHRWPGAQPKFDYLAKKSNFSFDRDRWEIYN